MSNQKATYAEGNFYHLYNRGHDRSKIFFEEKNYLFFMKRLEEKICNHHMDIISYCLMPNHYHLLVYVNAGGNAPKQMQALGTSYSKAVNKAYQKTGGLFQGAYKGIHVDKNEYLVYLSKYIHMNPVKAGMVKRPEDYHYSSYGNFFEERKDGFVKPDVILSQFKNADDYVTYVNDNDISYLKKLKEHKLIFEE